MQRALAPSLLALLVASNAVANPPPVEPVTLALTGWSVASRDDGSHLHADYRRTGTTCEVMLDRWWGLPPTPGPPMTTQSHRPVRVDGQLLSLLTASAGSLHGEALFIHHAADYARIWFTSCSATEENDVLARTHLAR